MLSESERSRLQQIERQLIDDDPRLALSFSRSKPPRRPRSPDGIGWWRRFNWRRFANWLAFSALFVVMTLGSGLYGSLMALLLAAIAVVTSRLWRRYYEEEGNGTAEPPGAQHD
ncbi:DUF3040 domain-containing protein [Saxibacter everestensis]|uniref:DUF3040 domain-containing protein n=1 Tax=Saxibacter everestensis TaxID=2909229 RepID=A0ABY8QUP0_9MICO|nr:DUF3040 domain-containing protein [Brevibacteriaceae bacterium ZFBP1038]